MICAIINSQKVVINTIVVDSLDFAPPEGCVVIDVTDMICGIGFLYDAANNNFIDTRPSE